MTGVISTVLYIVALNPGGKHPENVTQKTEENGHMFVNLSEFRILNDFGFNGSFPFTPTYIVKVGALPFRSEV